MRVLDGLLASGHALAHQADGLSLEISAEQLKHGIVLRLNCMPPRVGHQKKLSTARDWFKACLQKNRRVYAEAVLATLVMSCLALFTSIYTMQVYDRVVPTRGFDTLWVLTSGVALAILLEFLMKEARAHLVERASKRIDLELSDVFFAKALNIRLDARPKTVGTLLRKFGISSLSVIL